MMAVSQLQDLLSLDILDIFRAKLYLSQAYLVTETVAVIKNESDQLIWVKFSPTFHSR